MHRARSLLPAAVLALCAGLGAGCGSAPDTSPPTGVDGLEIPTPSPDTRDFVAQVDNPYLALEPGTRWTYAVDDGAATQEATLSVTVERRTREVAGIEATVVAEVLRDARGAVLEQRERWLAQDTAGNVWLLGVQASAAAGRGGAQDGAQEGVESGWEAGVDGARAGLAMPAAPRVGDGFRAGLAPGEYDDRVRILGVDATLTVPAGRFSEVLETEVTHAAAGGPDAEPSTSTTWYAAGTGLLGEQVVTGGVRRIELVSVQRP